MLQNPPLYIQKFAGMLYVSGIIPSAKRMIKYYSNTYYLSMPKMLFTIHKYDLRTNCSNAQIVALVDGSPEFYLPCLPNTNLHGHLCLGDSIYEYNSVCLYDLWKKAQDVLWKSVFTNGINEATDAYWETQYLPTKNKLISITDWNYRTKKDPNWVPSAVELLAIPTCKTEFLLPTLSPEYYKLQGSDEIPLSKQEFMESLQIA